MNPDRLDERLAANMALASWSCASWGNPPISWDEAGMSDSKTRTPILPVGWIVLPSGTDAVGEAETVYLRASDIAFVTMNPPRVDQRRLRPTKTPPSSCLLLTCNPDPIHVDVMPAEVLRRIAEASQ